MKIRILGCVLSFLFLVIVAYLLYFIDVGIGITVTEPSRLISLGSEVVTIIFALSNMLWTYRGIDMIVQAVFLIVTALAASVFFAESSGRRKEK
jgi:hypothetical protein